MKPPDYKKEVLALKEVYSEAELGMFLDILDYCISVLLDNADVMVVMSQDENGEYSLSDENSLVQKLGIGLKQMIEFHDKIQMDLISVPIHWKVCAKKDDKDSEIEPLAQWIREQSYNIADLMRQIKPDERQHVTIEEIDHTSEMTIYKCSDGGHSFSTRNRPEFCPVCGGIVGLIKWKDIFGNDVWRKGRKR